MPFNPTDDPNDIFETGQVEPYLTDATAVDSTVVDLDLADGAGDLAGLVWIKDRESLFDIARLLLVKSQAVSASLTNNSTLSPNGSNTSWEGVTLSIIPLDEVDLDAGIVNINQCEIDMTASTISTINKTLNKQFSPPTAPETFTVQAAKYYSA